MSLINGRIPTSLLRSVKTQRDMKLRKNAAISIDRVIASVERIYGWRPKLNDAYRSRARQGEFIKRYYSTRYRSGMSVSNGGLRYYQGKRWYRKAGMPTAATPGYSNHGLGLAVDVDDLGGFNSKRYKQFAYVAGKHGWSNAEGRRIGEAWHWVKVSGAKSSKDLKVDGKWGSSTTKRLQQVLDAPYVDGKISRQSSTLRRRNPGLGTGWKWNGRSGDGGSQTIRLLQKHIGASVDGKIGPKTIAKLQRHLGTPVDGVVSSPSSMVKELQRHLNAGKV